MSRLKLFLIYEITVLCTMAFVIGLGFLVTQNTNKEDAIDSKIISAYELKVDVERSLSFGKTYSEDTNFSRLIDTMIYPIAGEINLHSISFVNAQKENNVLYTFSIDKGESTALGNTLPRAFYTTSGKHDLIEYGGLYWIKVDLYKRNFRDKTDEGIYAGAYVMSFSGDDFFIPIMNFINIYLFDFTLIFLAASFILYLLIFRSSIKFMSEDGQHFINKSYLYTIVLIGQMALSAILLQGLYDFFIKDSQNILQRTATVQGQKIVRLLELGLPIETLDRSSEFFTNKLDINENIYAFNILDKDKNSVVDIIMGENPYDAPPVLTELRSKQNTILGYIETQLDVTGINARLMSAIADLLTVFIISLLVSSEFMFLFTLPNPKSIKEKTLLAAESFMGYTRFIHALIGCAYALALSFLPLKMLSMLQGGETLVAPMFISSLPLSAELFGTVISFYLSGKYALKYGWQRTLFAGGIIYAFAATVSSYTVVPEIFIASRALAGFGYGFVFLPILMYATSILPAQKTGTCFAVTNAGFMSGFMTGASLGGILVTQTSAELPFLLAALISALLMCYVFYFLKTFFADIQIESPKSIAAQNAKPDAISLLKYISNRNIWGTLALVLIPYAAAQIGLLSYGLPVTLSELGFSASTVGRAIMMYGLIQVYIAPSLTRYFESFANRKLVLISGVGIAVLGFLIAGFNAYTPFLAIVIVGIASAIVYPMASAFSVNQPISERYGKEKAVMIYKLTDKTGQALGPIFLGLLFSAYSHDVALIILGVGLVVVALGFALLVKSKN